MSKSTHQNYSKLDAVARYFSTIILQYWPVLLVIGLLFITYCTYITLQTADLGRHIVNGRELLAGNSQLLYTNYYSFAQSSQPFINHHWLFGIVAFWLQKSIGFSGLTLFNAIINTLGFIFSLLLTLFIFQKKLKAKLSHKATAVLVSLSAFFALPLFTHRLEVRPESFSLFLFSLFYLCLELLNQKIVDQKSLIHKIRKSIPIVLILLILQITWTNTHLFFVLGPLLVGYQLFFATVTWMLHKSKNNKTNVLFWTLLTIIFFASTLISPHGIKGLIAPFTIFDNYAYRVAENQSSWFMISYGKRVIFFSYMLVLSLVLGATFLWKITKKHIKLIKYFFLALIFAMLANYINRMSSFFGVTLIPVLTWLLLQVYLILKKRNLLNLENSVSMLIASSVAVVVSLLVLFSGLFLPKSPFGFGLLAGTPNAAQFIKDFNISGPFFNNYDSGGYFTYYLYPQHQPYIDNRPEAYSTKFIEEEYTGALKNEENWSKINVKYNFNAIFFYRFDQSDRAQLFLYERVADPDWIPVYSDNAFLIFVKNTAENQELIENFRIPDDAFVMKDI